MVNNKECWSRTYFETNPIYSFNFLNDQMIFIELTGALKTQNFDQNHISFIILPSDVRKIKQF